MNIPEYRHPAESIGGLSTLGEFWRWAMSDVLNNRNRGILAEFIVGKLLEADMSCPRVEWDCYDLIYRSRTVEVKSSAFVQSWHRSGERSKIKFSIGPRLCWDSKTNTYSSEKKRWAEIYIFCLFPANKDDSTRDVLDLAKWAFYVTLTPSLDLHFGLDRQNIGLAAVQTICGDAISHLQLKTCVDFLLDQ